MLQLKVIPFFLLKVFILLLFLGNQLKAQSIDHDWIVLENNDTIVGSVEVSTGSRTPHEIKFSSAGSMAVIKYGVHNLKAFMHKQSIFERHHLKVDYTPETATKLRFEHRGEEWDTLFLNVVVNDNATLFYHRDLEGKRHFFLSMDTIDMVELKRSYILQTSGEMEKLVRKDDYIGQLLFYLKDCPQLKEVIPGTLFSAKSMGTLFSAFNACNEDLEGFDYRTWQGVKIKVRSGPLIGFGLATMNLEEKEGFGLEYPNLKMGPNLMYTVGWGWELIPKHFSKNWSLWLEAAYVKRSFSDEGTQFSPLGNLHQITYTFNYNSIVLGEQFRYQLTENYPNAFIGFGVFEAFHFYYRENRKTEKIENGTTLVDEGPALGNTQSNEYGLNLTANLSWPKLFVEMKLDYGFGPSGYSSLVKSRTSNAIIRVGYFLKEITTD